MSYMTENSAHKFYDGVDLPEDLAAKKVQEEEEEHIHDHSHQDQNVINYCIIQTKYEQKVVENSRYDI